MESTDGSVNTISKTFVFEIVVFVHTGSENNVMGTRGEQMALPDSIPWLLNSVFSRPLQALGAGLVPAADQSCQNPR